MKHLPTVTKFLAILGVFGLFVIGSTIYVTTEMRGLTAGFEHVNATAGTAALDITTANQALDGAEADIEWLLIDTTNSGIQGALGKLATNRKKFDALMVGAEKAVPQQADVLTSLQTRGDTLLNASCAQSIKLGAAAATPAEVTASQKEFLSHCLPGFPSLINDLAAVRDSSRKQVGNDQAILDSAAGKTIFTTFALVLVSLIVILVCGFFVVQAWIVSPIKGLQKTMGDLAGGNLRAVVAGIERRDEIGGMARAVQIFKDAGLEKQRLEEDAKAAAAQMDAERVANEAARAETAAQQRRVVDSVAAGLVKLSGGDLMFRLTEAFSA
ncbi:MAG TPA: HAMP domain-containing protein, partial [Acidocella sp.]|uniref:HAMP domain-containing protein n=1 Tax=Acidocella sp. TaxID=50710 RepID=UPI002BE76D90